MEAALYGGIEAGGTKFVCAVASGPENILAESRFRTRGPEETIREASDFFLPHVRSGRIKGIGLGSFGPLDLQPGSPTYGSITSTPKPGWQNVRIAETIREQLQVPVVVDTDVNAAALGEHTWGASKGLDPSLYLTVGTGIGGGLVKDGRPYHGLLSPEMGHIRIPHDLSVDPFAGACPFHGDCLEGLAAGPAIEKRMGRRGETLDDDDPVWEWEADYLAHAVANYVLTLSPAIVIMGGGIMDRAALLPRVREKVQGFLNGYVKHTRILQHIEGFIVPPLLGRYAGVLGAIALIQKFEAA
ncbi:MAG: ROK family protein [Bacteroidota bacterium]